MFSRIKDAPSNELCWAQLQFSIVLCARCQDVLQTRFYAELHRVLTFDLLSEKCLQRVLLRGYTENRVLQQSLWTGTNAILLLPFLMFFVFVVLLVMLFVGYEIFCGFLKKAFVCVRERERDALLKHSYLFKKNIYVWCGYLVSRVSTLGFCLLMLHWNVSDVNRIHNVIDSLLLSDLMRCLLYCAFKLCGFVFPLLLFWFSSCLIWIFYYICKGGNV